MRQSVRLGLSRPWGYWPVGQRLSLLECLQHPTPILISSIRRVGAAALVSAKLGPQVGICFVRPQLNLLMPFVKSS